MLLIFLLQNRRLEEKEENKQNGRMCLNFDTTISIIPVRWTVFGKDHDPRCGKMKRWRDLQYSQSVDDTENVQLKQEPNFFTFWISTSPQFDIKATCSQYRQNSFSEYWEITCSDCYREARGEDKDFGVSIRGGDLKLLTRTENICDLLLL